MSLENYTALKAELTLWIAHSNANADGRLDTYIDLFEGWANRNLRVRQMEDEATSPAAEYMALPTDFLELRDIQFQGDPRRQLSYVTPQYADMYDSTGTPGLPNFYTIVGNEIRLIPSPSSTTDVRISYYKQIPALHAGNETNWLLAYAPDAYLYGSLMHARMYLHDPSMAGFIQSAWASVMADIRKSGKESNLGSSLQIRAG